MSDKKLSPGLKMLLEYGPIAAFFIGYMLLKDQVFTLGGREYAGFIAVTAVFVPLVTLTTFLQWRLSGHISPMQIMTVVLVVFFGGLSVALNDERFIKMKPTMIYLLFASILGFGLLRGQSYLKMVMDSALKLEHRGWMILTLRVTLFFLALAVANEVIWRTMSTEAWVKFKTFGLTLGVFAFFMTQSGLVSKYAIEDDQSES